MIDQDKLDELLDQWEAERERGRELSPDDLCSNCPEMVEIVTSQIHALKATDWLMESDDDEEDDFLSLPPELSQGLFAVPASVSLEQFTSSLTSSRLLTQDDMPRFSAENAQELAAELMRAGKLTTYQAEQICSGNTKGLVLGNYVILGQIGAGGMGQVFKARHKRMDRVVALKMLPKKALESINAIERFQREVKAAAHLEHPNVVTAFDADEFDGTHFLVMQFVDGDDLSSLVKKKGRLSVTDAVDCVIQAAQGLEYAHREGVIHRDIKPGNLLLDKKGVVKILDMGLARLDKSTPEDGFAPTQAELTQDGSVLGTIDYMAPEQAEDTRLADARSDIYSLGCTLYYLLHGKAIYSGNTLMARMLAHREHDIPSLRAERDDIPEELDAIFAKMVAKNPEERYPTMTALLEELATVSHHLEQPWTDDGSYATEGLADADSKVDMRSMETSSSGDTVATVRRTAWPPAPVEQSPWPGLIGNRRLVAGGGIALLIGVLAVWLLGIILKVETPHGVIVIETNVADVEVFVDNQKAVHIVDPTDQKKIKVEIPPGSKTLRVTKPGFEAFVQAVDLKTANGPIKVKMLPLTIGNGNADRRFAEWAIANGGEVQINDKSDRIKDIKQLPQGSFALTWLFFPEATAEQLASLHKLDHLRHLSLPHYNNVISDETLAEVAKLGNLEEIRASGDHVAISDSGIASLESLKDLEKLQMHFRSHDLTDACLKSIATHLNLTICAIPKLPSISPEAICHLGKLNKLQYLWLAGEMDDDGIEALIQCGIVQRLGSLAVTRNSKVTDQGFLQLLRALDNKQTTQLTLQYTNASDAICPTLTEFHNLTHLNLQACPNITDAGLKHLSKLKNLVWLYLQSTSVTADGVRELQQALPDCDIYTNAPSSENDDFDHAGPVPGESD